MGDETTHVTVNNQNHVSRDCLYVCKNHVKANDHEYGRKNIISEMKTFVGQWINLCNEIKYMWPDSKLKDIIDESNKICSNWIDMDETHSLNKMFHSIFDDTIKSLNEVDFVVNQIELIYEHTVKILSCMSKRPNDDEHIINFHLIIKTFVFARFISFCVFQQCDRIRHNHTFGCHAWNKDLHTFASKWIHWCTEIFPDMPFTSLDVISDSSSSANVFLKSEECCDANLLSKSERNFIQKHLDFTLWMQPELLRNTVSIVNKFLYMIPDNEVLSSLRFILFLNNLQNVIVWSVRQQAIRPIYTFEHV